MVFKTNSNTHVISARKPRKTHAMTGPQDRFTQETVPDLYQNHFRIAYTGRSLAKAIKAKCLDCCCYISKEVTLCPVETCPLWRIRPYQKKDE